MTCIVSRPTIAITWLDINSSAYMYHRVMFHIMTFLTKIIYFEFYNIQDGISSINYISNLLSMTIVCLWSRSYYSQLCLSYIQALLSLCWHSQLSIDYKKLLFMSPAVPKLLYVISF